MHHNWESHATIHDGHPAAAASNAAAAAKEAAERRNLPPAPPPLVKAALLAPLDAQTAVKPAAAMSNPTLPVAQPGGQVSLGGVMAGQLSAQPAMVSVPPLAQQAPVSNPEAASSEPPKEPFELKEKMDITGLDYPCNGFQDQCQEFVQGKSQAMAKCASDPHCGGFVISRTPDSTGQVSVWYKASPLNLNALRANDNTDAAFTTEEGKTYTGPLQLEPVYSAPGGGGPMGGRFEPHSQSKTLEDPAWLVAQQEAATSPPVSNGALHGAPVNGAAGDATDHVHPEHEEVHPVIDPVTGLGSLPPNKQPPDMHGPSERVVPPVQCRTEAQTMPVSGLGKIDPIHVICGETMSCLGEGVVPCDVPCEWALKGSGKPWENQADAVVSGVLGGSTGVLEPGGNKVIWSMEGQCHYPRLRTAEKEVNSTMLLSAMLMQFTSPVPMPYFSWVEYDLQDAMPGYDLRQKAVVFVAKNCNSLNGREAFVRSMIKFGVQVDSISSCLNNAEWPDDVPRNHKHGVLQRYLFYFAAENCCEDDYVSEKVYHGLAAGAVPIYLGAPNIDTFVPKDSILVAPQQSAGEEAMKKFADKILKIANSKEEWQKMVAWRNKPLEEWFKKKFSFTCVHSSCRLCRYVYARKHKLPWNHELQRVEWPEHPADFDAKATFK